MSWDRSGYAGLGARATWGAVGAVVVGVAAFVTGKGTVESTRTFGAFLAAWLFFAGLAMGAVAVRALFRVVPARWANPVAAAGGSLAAFVPFAALTLAVVLTGAVPRFSTTSGWLAPASLVGRNVLLDAVLFGFAWLRFRRPPDDAPPPSLAASVGFLVVFGLVLSTWSFDFVVGPDPTFADTLIGPFVFTGAFLAGMALATLLALARGALPDPARRDAASLVFALAIFWGYLFCSQALTFWYGNQLDEIVFALRRLADGWELVVWAVVALVFALPFLGLLHPAARRSPAVLAVVLGGQLLGLWLTCYLLVVPSLAPRGAGPFEPRDLLVSLGMLGLFVLAVAPALEKAPAPA